MLDLNPCWLLAIFVLISMASYIVGLIAHEFGHAGIGWLVGMPPRLIRIGEGPRLFRIKLGSAMFDMRRWPIYGYVGYLPPPVGRTGARILRLSGGMIVNALLLAATILLWSRSSGFDDQAFWALSIGNAQFSLFAVSFIPLSSTWRGQRLVSDMLAIIRLLRGQQTNTFDEFYAAQMRLVLPDGAAIPTPSADAAEIVYHVTRHDRLNDRWGRRDASAGLQKVLARDALSKPERILVLQNLALIERHKGDESSPASMDAWSQEAIALAPRPHALVVRGGVLVSLGRHAEALALLSSVMAVAAAAGSGRLCQAYINVAQAQLRLQAARAAAARKPA
jgi:hypothetical protein